MERVCVIGAGSSGIAAAQVLRARGLPFTCFETGSSVGGNWRYGNDNGMSSAYRSLHINTSRQQMQYSTFPMPDSLPDYPSHTQIAAYFDAYVEHFGLAGHIRFRTEVTAVRPLPGGGYRVHSRSLADGAEAAEDFRAVLVANGHHWDPRWPEPAFPGVATFTGEQLHAHHYRTPDVLAGKRVLVLGFGNSACDIAVESSRVAERTVLAFRRGEYVLPKYFFGKPTDSLVRPSLTLAMPMAGQRLILKTLLRLKVGKMSSYGLPDPEHKLFASHPTISEDLLSRLGHGDIQVRPNLARFDGGRVHFTDGSVEEIDTVVYCTGYRITFPFLGEDVIAPVDNRVRLYRRVVSVEHPGLYFIGLVQPIGAIMPLAEAQAAWVADLLDGTAALPSPAVMRRSIAAYERSLRRRYVASKRHTIQVDFHPYLHELSRERKAGARRAG
ncbi:cation diffusion facilitator CzcD-associated flavoprotein CzcO [Crossiella equi]|uniref:Flavin-containing monooxygenase 5 n=1 Tax=Crossiella equi TaxID=130796 RepID=A0ABS5APE1_9PSEU|nr:NAD(P)-binding domain-containing protein [Crossiella equi]MBP2478074.1 cation diffusion facilitator CzcD-associated flavoprotein CzcO [Crossiella equi]